MRYTYNGLLWGSINIAPEPVKQMAEAMRLVPEVTEMTVTFVYPDSGDVARD